MKFISTIQLPKKYFASILLLVFYISEAFSKYAIFYEGGKSEIPRAIKLVALLIVFISIIKPLKNILYPAILLVIFVVGQLFLEKGFNPEIIVSFSKFLFPIILFIYFNKNAQNKEARQTLFRVFEGLLIINSILMIIGLCGNVYIFKAYAGFRFGYNGLLITTATSSYVYTLALFYFLLKTKSGFLKDWKSLFIIGSCVLLGTKVIYIALLGTLLLYVFYFGNLSRNLRKIVVGSIGLISGCSTLCAFFQMGAF